ncbi:class I SAM-dependent methyltransferase [Gracilibacillus salinarum]|uniref:Class I SAM-dependent methyltransferase n=1 Tax=Gracilibacillus salinarum TaxID=2932255 RepID=A0ABY4GNE2_9BACI|nr:class I SAM-dependent methyltransferase [Gracilibacillus salinarum]UOQ85754.1 class I SAM-dependent methyltransferase [Gracilibacillus salinarum]
MQLIDSLTSAIEKLQYYSHTFEVEELIEPVRSDIGNYTIKKNEFDLIIAVSSLEHLASEDLLVTVLQDMAAGTKVNGINCIIANTEVEEILMETGEKLDPLIEINLST